MTESAAPIGRYPPWAREIESLLVTAGLFIVSGNVRDLYFSPSRAPRSLPQTLVAILQGQGIDDVAVVRAGGASSARVEDIWSQGVQAAQLHGPSPTGLEHQDSIPAMPGAPISQLGGLAALLMGGPARALVVLDASRAVLDVTRLSLDEATMFREVQRAVEDQVVEVNGRYNPVIWVVDANYDVPAWFASSSGCARSISVPLPTATDRDSLAARLLPVSLRGESVDSLERARRSLVDQTDGLPLLAVSQINALVRQIGGTPSALDDAIRLYRLGVLDNPWTQPYLVEKLRMEVADGPQGKLHQRVIGQSGAIEKSLDVLVRSVSGLRSTQGSSRAGRPRGVLFFAGPTGVGKTELAKGLAQLLFGDEASLVRFDMSEFASDHSAERLVGAPPGYVGFAQGGELTNAVRQRPFTLLLFDEIEKAHHSLLDRFLQILDDGRLTDGRGETTYFSESVIVFTSNLGIYDVVVDPITHRPVGRTLAVRPVDGTDALVDSVRERVEEHFTSVVGRPELLNRIGDNIVVFDFIHLDVGRSILEKMVGSVAEAVRREHGAELILEQDAWGALEAACLNETNLLMGGRGIGNLVESVLIDPLARWMFTAPAVPSRVTVESISREGSRFSVVIRPVPQPDSR